MKKILSMLLVMAMVMMTCSTVMAGEDIPADWAAEEVEAAISFGLIQPNFQNNYTKPVTREEFCIMAIRLIEVKNGETIECIMSASGDEPAPRDTFVDCTTKEVLAAKALGITDGTSPTTFSPDKLLTRQEAAKFLTTTAIAMGNDVNLSTPSYADQDKIADWAKPYTGYVYDVNVMKGVGGNKFDPTGSYQRQQAIMTMYRLLKVSNPQLVTNANNNENSAQDQEGEKILDAIAKDINYKPYENNFKAVFEGSNVGDEEIATIKYDLYYRDGDIRVESYVDDFLAEVTIFRETSYRTYIRRYMGADYAQVIDDYRVPIMILDPERFDEMRHEEGLDEMEAYYEGAAGDENILYIRSVMKDGSYNEQWFDMKYKMAITYTSKLWNGNGYTDIDWQMVEIDETVILDDELFNIPSTEE